MSELNNLSNNEEIKNSDIKTHVKNTSLAVLEYWNKKKQDKKPMTIISLFSGCGGLDLGFEKAAGYHVFTIERVTGTTIDKQEPLKVKEGYFA